MKISIITPSLNQGQFLEQTINSVMDQKYPDLEYLIIDGGSTDGSIDIIKKYAQKYPGIIKWQSKKDTGQANAINQGLAMATGDIVAWINSDDYYLPESFKKVEQFFLQNKNSSWLVGECSVTDSKLAWTFAIKHLIPYDLLPKILYLFNWINQPSVFMKTDVVKKAGKLNESYHFAFDYEYWLRCLRFATPHKTHSQLAAFRIHSQSKGNTNYHKQFAEDLQIIKTYSKNPLTIFTHRLNRIITTTFYSFLK